MKNSILVAVIAATTMLAACASKDDAAVSSKGKVTALSEKSQQDLNNGSWISECKAVPAMVAAGSEAVRLTFSGEGMIKVSDLTYAMGSCQGVAVETPAELLTYTATEGKVIIAQINKVVKSTVDMIAEETTPVGQFSLTLNGHNLEIVALKTQDDVSYLVGKFNRELPARSASQRFGDFGVPTDAKPAQKPAPKGSERF